MLHFRFCTSFAFVALVLMYSLSSAIGFAENAQDGNHGLVSALAVSPDGLIAVSGDSEKHLCFWDLTTGTQIAATDLDSAIDSLCFSPKGDRLYCGLEGSVQVLNCGTWEKLSSILVSWPNSKRNAYVHGIAISADATVIALALQDTSGGWSGAVAVHSGDASTILRNPEAGPCIQVAFDSQGVLWCLFENGLLESWIVATRKQLQRWNYASDKFNQLSQVAHFAFVPGQQRIIVGTRDHRLIEIDSVSGKVIKTINSWDPSQSSTSPSLGIGSGTPIATVGISKGEDGKLYSVQGGRPLKGKAFEEETTLDVDSTGKYAVSTGGAPECHVWNLDSGTITYNVPASDIFSKAAFVPQRDSLIVVNKHFFMLWNCKTNRQVKLIGNLPAS